MESDLGGWARARSSCLQRPFEPLLGLPLHALELGPEAHRWWQTQRNRRRRLLRLRFLRARTAPAVPRCSLARQPARRAHRRRREHRRRAALLYRRLRHLRRLLCHCRRLRRRLRRRPAPVPPRQAALAARRGHRARRALPDPPLSAAQ
eukprot:6207451-Pleurochrysis_carterae.AAC.2